MKNVIQVDHRNLKGIIKHSYDRKLPVFVWGTFGIGKSYTVENVGKEYAKKMNLKYSMNAKDADAEHFVVLTIALHQFDPAEIKGLPVANHEKRITEFFSTGSLPQAGQGIIFFDELNLAPPMVQNNAYQLIWNRQLGDYILPEGFVAIGAGNTSEDRAHVNEMAMPLKNRFGHVELRIPTVKDWCEQFAFPQGIDHRITSFLLFREDYLFKYDPEMMEEIISTPSPRTWELASRSIKGIEDLNLVEQYAGMYVSAACGMELVDFIKMSIEVDISKIFTDKKVIVPKEISELYALITAIISYYSKKNNIKNAEIILDLLPSFKEEHAVIILKQLQAIEGTIFNQFLEGTKEQQAKMHSIAKKYSKLL